MRFLDSHIWDSQIVACALLSGCTVLESEDMQDGLVIDGIMTIPNTGCS